MKTIYFFLLMIFTPIILIAQWTQTNYPVGGQINSIAYTGNKLLVGNNSSGIYLSTDNGDTWTAVNKGFPSNSSVQDVIVKGNDIFAGTYKNGIFVFSEIDTSWTAINEGLTTNAIYNLTSDFNYLYAGTAGNGIFISSNNGSNWLSSGLPGKTIWDLSTNGTNIFAATSSYGIYISTDHGSTWTQNNTGLPSNKSMLAVEPINNYLFAGTAYNGVYISTDNGTNWVECNNGYPGTDTWCFTFKDTNIFMGSSSGIFLSTDKGSSWSDISTGMTDKWTIASIVKNNYVFAGTAGSGILYRRSIDNIFTDVKNNKNQLPNEFLLNQNYPNPFNPTTTIKYDIPKTSSVTLKVYNVLGQEVATLVNEKKEAGSYEVQLDGSKLSSGVYFYRLTAGILTETKKLILLR
jgi:photosystem II stability/assembly factor-like uncharacterized protein